MSVHTLSATAPVNIATLKYWGKRDKVLNLPTNSSISVTLSQDDLRTLTSVSTAKSFEKDQFWLNGTEESLQSERTQNCLKELRSLRAQLETTDESLPKFSQWKLKIVSSNNFPTAAGLASSAAGFAAFVYSIAKLYQLPQTNSELSIIARQGSGSACRSLFGGFVAWEMGLEQDGLDSKAVEVSPLEHWSEIKAAILVVSADKKDTPSTSGMQTTVHTSDLFQWRIKEVVPTRFEEMKQSIVQKDFPKFAELTMKDSNSFHATCLDSYPPIFYLNDTSKKIIKLVHAINDFYGETIAAYTFDAGPNAVIYYLEKDESKLFSILYRLFKKNEGWNTKYTEDDLIKFSAEFEKLESRLNFALDDQLYEGVSRVILTRVGDGPAVTTDSLVDSQGNPLL